VDVGHPDRTCQLFLIPKFVTGTNVGDPMVDDQSNLLNRTWGQSPVKHDPGRISRHSLACECRWFSYFDRTSRRRPCVIWSSDRLQYSTFDTEGRAICCRRQRARNVTDKVGDFAAFDQPLQK
jgi:hypothetical protein